MTQAANKNKVIASRNKAPQEKSIDEQIDTGLNAKSFKNSKEFEYLENILEEIEVSLLNDKLNLAKDNASGLHDICVKIALLDEIKGKVDNDIYMGNRANERKAREINEKPKKA